MKSGSIRVLLADGQALTAAGLTSFLSEREEIDFIGGVHREEELFEMLHLHKPALLIADYNISGHITPEHLKQAVQIAPQMNILIISSDSDKQNIHRVLQLGVKGYLTKECSKEEIIMAIQATAKGEKFFCHKILDIIMEKSFAPEPANCDPTVLTVRETEILKLIASGKSTQKIAEELFLSPHTVHTHRKSIIRKLNIKSPTEFVIYAMDFGLIKTK